MTIAAVTFIYGTFIPACGHNISKHFKGYYTLQYMDAGAVDVSVGQQTYALNGRWFWSAWPGPLIAFRPATGTRTWAHRYLAFQGSGVERWKRAGLFPLFPQRAPPGLDWAARLDDLIGLAARRDDLGRRRATNALEGILLELAEARARPPESDNWLSTVTRQLEEWVPQDSHDYQALARSLHISVSTLRRQFKRAMAASPHDYLLGLRVAAARRLLAESSIPVKEIAHKLGYKDVFYFSRQFRALAGVAPAAYRRSAQG